MLQVIFLGPPIVEDDFCMARFVLAGTVLNVFRGQIVFGSAPSVGKKGVGREFVAIVAGYGHLVAGAGYSMLARTELYEAHISLIMLSFIIEAEAGRT
ncbi:uncharacterized protein RCC_02144 [Ramularia collo-cygni]|uniref:Uncharacterized protein n=1 Tax=Ramularia collo-cygni TaxID=112498 RepID=A0A2D3UMB2_9PEZI|nr:uncharacterized protein RCC_02144 [Ramularia collo-cygni]CZT16302.1 uncharacterized protein RCC_02144 [Ramularia collo-cygni]